MAIEIEQLKNINYFAGLSQSDLASIARYITEQSVAKGHIFLFEGEWSDHLYFLVAGLVKVYKTSPNGKEQILHIAPPGESLNDVSTFDGGTNQASMLAMTPVHLYSVRKEELKNILEEHPRIYINILKALAYRIRRDSNLVEELSSTQVMGRLAKLLMGKYAGEEVTIGLWLTQQDMASMIGTCREVVNRSLKIMEEKGAIRLGRHRVIVLNKDILADMAKATVDTTPKYLQPREKAKK
ncbi:MAG TPA: Crp/Fnr family transcriptional regulator [Dehalococcoidales bacterium]|nr:Crp/Fnr family transcriptional regulator [Dehalococcoidales bacterium]